MSSASERVKTKINGWCDLEQNDDYRKRRQKYVICILDTLHDFYESPIKINNIIYKKPDIVLKWADYYLKNSTTYCPLSSPVASVVGIQLSDQELNFLGSNATTIGKELLFEWWDNKYKTSTIKYCRASFNRDPNQTNKGLFISRRQRQSYKDLIQQNGKLYVFSDQGVPKNPFKLQNGEYVNSIGIGGLYDKTTRASNTSDTVMLPTQPITLNKTEFEGVLGYNSVTINNDGNTFELNYNGTIFPKKIDDTDLSHAKTQFRIYASAPATPTQGVLFFTNWLNALNVGGNIGNILKKAIQSGPLSSQVSIGSQSYTNIITQIPIITSQLFEYLSLIFDLKRLGDWSQSYELNIIKQQGIQQGININSIFNTVDGIAAGCAVYFQEISTLLWRKTKNGNIGSQGFELYNYNKGSGDGITCIQTPKQQDKDGSPPSYPGYNSITVADTDFQNVNDLTSTFTQTLMGGDPTDPAYNITIACEYELGNNMNYYIDLILSNGKRKEYDKEAPNPYAIDIMNLCSREILIWIENDEQEMLLYFEQYLNDTINITERFKLDQQDDDKFYSNCLFCIFKYEFDLLISKAPNDDTKRLYSLIMKHFDNEIFSMLTLFVQFLSNQLIKDTIIDFLTPLYDEYKKIIGFSDSLIQYEQGKYELIMYMIKFELTRNDDERYNDFYNYSDRISTKRSRTDEYEDDAKSARTSGGKYKQNVIVKRQYTLKKSLTPKQSPKQSPKQPPKQPLQPLKIQPKQPPKQSPLQPPKQSPLQPHKQPPNITKYKLRVDQYKNKNLTDYFVKKLKTHLNDPSVNVYKMGIRKMRTILKDIYKIEK